MNISIVVLAHGHPEISNLLAVLASGRTCTLLGVLEVWEFCATLSQEERYLSRLFKVFRICGRFLYFCHYFIPRIDQLKLRGWLFKSDKCGFFVVGLFSLVFAHLCCQPTPLAAARHVFHVLGMHLCARLHFMAHLHRVSTHLVNI